MPTRSIITSPGPSSSLDLDFFFFFLNSKALFLLACRSQIKQVKDSPVQLCFQSMCSIIMDINRSKNCGFVVGFGASFRKSQP